MVSAFNSMVPEKILLVVRVREIRIQNCYHQKSANIPNQEVLLDQLGVPLFFICHFFALTHKQQKRE
jgi:hypothetical protein